MKFYAIYTVNFYANSCVKLVNFKCDFTQIVIEFMKSKDYNMFIIKNEGETNINKIILCTNNNAICIKIFMRFLEFVFVKTFNILHN